MSGGAERETVECYCTARTARELLFTPPLPLQNCRLCWMCSREFTDGSGVRRIGCHGKGVRSLDGREGQFCTIFLPRWNRSPEVIQMAQRCAWDMIGPDGDAAVA